MKTKFYVVFDNAGAVKMTKKYAPSLYRNEVAVCFDVAIPDGVFRAPVLQTTINIPEDRVLQPAEVVVSAAPVEESGAE